MLIWNREISKNFWSLFAIGTLSAIVALATVRPYSTALGQEPAPRKEPSKEPKPPPVKELEEKEPVKKSDPPVKDSKEKEPIKKAEEQVPEKKAEEKGPVKKSDEQAPAKGVKEKEPIKKSEEQAPVKRSDEKGPMKKTEEKNPVKGSEVKDPNKKIDENAPRKKSEEIGKDGPPMPRKEVKEPGEGKRPGKDEPKVTPKEDDRVVIEGLPDDFDDQQRQEYRRIENQDLPFEEYLRFAKLEFRRIRQLKMNPDLRYQPGQRGRSTPNTACGDAADGDFELLFDPNDPNHDDDVNSAEWSGAYGIVLPTGVPDYLNFTMGLLPGVINNANSHQTIVGAGADPNVPIQMTGPNTYTSNPISPNAVRIGNAVNGAGSELLSKTFTVTPSETLIRFWYAVVMEDPLPIPGNTHAPHQKPAFQVRVLDNSTSPATEVMSVVNLGNGTPKLVADTVNNPFFKVQNRPSQPETPLAYTDWQCAQINLTTMVGNSVTIEFVTQDCTKGGHWAYAYVDDFCGTCDGNPGGDIAFDPKTSTECGKGQVCYNYTLPTAQYAAGIVTGTAVITLDIVQNGVVLQTLTSPTLSSLTNYCFPIDPATIPGLDLSMGFDLVANAIFTLSGYNLPLSVGSLPDGRIPGQNNDYNDPRICNGKPKECGCCPGENFVKNGDFEQNGEIGSEYHQADLDQQVPGTYSVNHVDKIGKACLNWKLPKACDGTKNFHENVLIVNGLTNQPAGSTSVIWSQQIVLPSDAGLKGADYRLCFRYLPLPQCCFDIQAKPILLVNDGRIPLTDVCDEDTGCGHLYAATFHGAGTINLQIVLPEDGKGDGNDLLIDNISMVKIVPVPANLLTFSPDAENVANGMFDVTSVIAPGLASTCTWDWELYRGNAPDVMDPAFFTLVQPSTQSNQPTSTFTGVPISDGNGKPILYWVKLTVECECSRGAVHRPAGQFSKSLKLEGKSIEDPNPQRVKRGKAVPALVPAKRSE